MRIVFFGTPHFAVPSLRKLVEAGEDVVAVVCQPDRRKGRGHQLGQPPVKELALERGIRVVQPESVRGDAFNAELSGLHPDLIAVVAYGKILPKHVLAMPPLGCVNVHASLLPKYRGAAPIQWAIINGEKKTGVTTMLMDEGLDTGATLLFDETGITDTDDASTLGARLADMGAALLLKTIRGLRDGSVRPLPQSGEPSFAPPLKKEDGRIDWSKSAVCIRDLIRGASPWPGAYCFLEGQRLTVIKAGLASIGAEGSPGRIIEISEDAVRVSAGSGVVELFLVKPDGKKTMSASAFMHGRRTKAGAGFDLL